jgi:hypothetical protein
MQSWRRNRLFIGLNSWILEEEEEEEEGIWLSAFIQSMFTFYAVICMVPFFVLIKFKDSRGLCVNCYSGLRGASSSVIIRENMGTYITFWYCSSFPGGKGAGRESDQPLQAPRFRTCLAIPPLPYMSSWRRIQLNTGRTLSLPKWFRFNLNPCHILSCNEWSRIVI